MRRSLGLIALVLASASHVAADALPQQVPDEPRGVVSLEQALEAALVRNPELATVRLDVRIQEARVLQAGLLPNPSLATEVEDVGGTGPRRGWASGQTTLSVAQLLELGGKRSKRTRAAALEHDLATFDYDARRLGVLADVAKTFAATLAAQDRVTLARELEALAGESVRSVAATVKAGAVSPVEETRARVAEGRAATDRQAAERDLLAARTVLAATWGGTEARFDRVVGRLGAVTPPEPLDVLRSRIDRNPDLARWNAERTRREAALAVERARRVPDVTLSLGGRHYADNGDEALVFGFSLPLPVFDRNQGNVAAAELAVARTERDRWAAAVVVSAALETAYATLQTAFAQATALRDRIIPEAERTYDGARDAYTRGLFRYLEVLDAQRTLFELRGQYLTVLRDYHQAAADVTRLTGAPPGVVDAPKGGDR